jgi:uncharacterized membrane protein YhaH (DUF805 family)
MAHVLHKGFYWIGMAAAIAILFLPAFMGGKSSSGGNFGAALGAALAPIISMVALSIIAVIASAVAAIAAAIAAKPPQARSPSWRPVLLAVITCTLSMLILIAMGTFR